MVERRSKLTPEEMGKNYPFKYDPQFGYDIETNKLIYVNNINLIGANYYNYITTISGYGVGTINPAIIIAANMIAIDLLSLCECWCWC